MLNTDLDKISIDVYSRRILLTIFEENPHLERILRRAESEVELKSLIRDWIEPKLMENPAAEAFYRGEEHDRDLYCQLSWRDYALIRILDYLDYSGKSYTDQNIHGEPAETDPFKILWLATNRGIGGATPDFFIDMRELFRQLNGKLESNIPQPEEIKEWMARYPSGLDSKIISLRRENRDRIISLIINKIDSGEISSQRFFFESDTSRDEKIALMNRWWDDGRFHLTFAVRSAATLNEMLNFSLDPRTMEILYDAEEKGIPFFINPYYLSLLNVHTPGYSQGGDLTIRSYVVYSRELVEEFGQIEAWEKEDKVQPGEPNAAGWIVPSHNIHRRYPEVAIFIPDTMGRACAGLCSSCQRMYDFQSGRYNFNLKKLKPAESWSERLPKLLKYFKDDAQLRDILLTGGDAFMSSDKSLKKILDEIYKMALSKKLENKKRSTEEKYAEIVRIRIGTRLPVYLPQRITPELSDILAEFKEKASSIGVKQFVIQTHFISPMEITPEAKRAVQILQQSGWVVANQLVFTAQASRRGHTAKLRKVLNDIGVLTYYTFTVKGFKENSSNFAPSARSVQESIEEKYLGRIPEDEMDEVQELIYEAETITEHVNKLREEIDLPFLATDRNILNLPGVGKSLTFRTVGITRYGRRILQFDHDHTRSHSPVIDRMDKIVVIESKSINEYLRQLEDMGEERAEYSGLYGYSIGETEQRVPLYEYPEYDFNVTDEMTNFELKLDIDK